MAGSKRVEAFYPFSLSRTPHPSHPPEIRSFRTRPCHNGAHPSVDLQLRAAHPDTAAQAYRLLAAIYNTAVEDRLLPRSPCKVKGASQQKNPERPVASVEEIAAATDAMDEPFRLSVPLACYCRLRRGEVLGLQRKHVDIEHAVLRVEQAWTVSGGKMNLGPPKTEEGRRDVVIPPNVVPLLVDHLNRFAGIGPDGWLFEGPHRSVVSPRTIDRQWAKARKAIERPDLHYHDLRHTGLTFVAMTGATTAEIMASGGHASPAAAFRYQHATQPRMTAIANALAAIADGRLQPLAPTKGHAGDTTSSGASADRPQAEGPIAAVHRMQRDRPQRAGRIDKRKVPGKHPVSNGQAPKSPSDDPTQDDATSA